MTTTKFKLVECLTEDGEVVATGIKVAQRLYPFASSEDAKATLALWREQGESDRTFAFLPFKAYHKMKLNEGLTVITYGV